MNARQLEAEFNAVLKPEYGLEGEQNGLKLGDPEKEVSRVTFSWTATAKVLEEAASIGAEAIFAHEMPFVPVYKGGGWWPSPNEGEMPVNRIRRGLYEKHGFVMFQYHSPLDGWPVWGMPRALADALGFDPADADWPNRFVPVFDLAPQPVRVFALRVRDRLGLTGVGVSGDLDREMHRVALMIGGFGGAWSVSEIARAAGADAMVCGELSDYTVRAAAEAGISVIKASHYSTENPAVKKLAEHMGKRLAGRVEAIYLDCGESWHTFGAPLEARPERSAATGR